MSCILMRYEGWEAVMVQNKQIQVSTIVIGIISAIWSPSMEAYRVERGTIFYYPKDYSYEVPGVRISVIPPSGFF